MAKNCPNCGLINPDTVEHCDCGYDFVAKTRRPARSEVAGRSNRTRKVSSDFLVRALEPQLSLGWLITGLGLLVVAAICVISAGKVENLGKFCYVVVALSGLLIGVVIVRNFVLIAIGREPLSLGPKEQVIEVSLKQELAPCEEPI